MEQMVIGITGGSGTGKSTVSKMLQAKGWFVIDADDVAHAVMEKGTPCLQEVRDLFGEGILDGQGRLMRKKLGEIVFSDPEKLKLLNEITFRYITEEVKKRLQGKERVVIDAPLLFESGLDALCSRTLFVSCPEEERIKRIMDRDRVDFAYAQKRVRAQQNDDFYRGLCSGEIVNDGKRNLEDQLGRLLHCIK